MTLGTGKMLIPLRLHQLMLNMLIFIAEFDTDFCKERLSEETVKANRMQSNLGTNQN
ncbi:hypothetical protein [Vibrio sp. MA40-2]|uniref:hypothetical protein n=1 Tax=Vibrio sp. MA40-2 TaxID=3391828 RepID=UPI0039A67964